MAKVHITNVVVLDNPSSFFNPFQFELTFECIEELKEDLEWKMIYVGSAESEEYDQVLDTIYVGPVPEGRHIFVFQADPPDVTKIPEQDAVGVTIVLLTCSYRGQEFVRVGYFINNDYADPEMRENPPPKPLFDKLTRNILATKPRITRFKINWDDTPSNGLLNGNGQLHAHAMGNTDDGASTSTSAGVLAAGSNGNSFNGTGCESMDTPEAACDDNSLNMPIENGVNALNENSNSLAMEC
ncbi:histone chaperone asf1 [Bactrocera neohumeralis]|uniref:histone chaperone asf1 n=1 Tax=Bactrocera tryoni TaxID=59916 RepID=UPI001A983393|nr:histone chaperone asf1 [Bactrocera tryoni]XP_050335615.1 histone chaperone asf1 [Bactrocera neohumeralis]